jgi:hypothetical protein
MMTDAAGKDDDRSAFQTLGRDEVLEARRRSEGLVKALGVAGAVALLIRIFGK